MYKDGSAGFTTILFEELGLFLFIIMNLMFY